MRLVLLGSQGLGWIFWAFLGASLVHVLEEYLKGWVKSVRHYLLGVTVAQFAAVNALLLVGCLAAALVNTGNLIFSLSMGALILVNALIHVGVSLWRRRYTPGLLSSVLLYLPLSVYSFHRFLVSGRLKLGDAFLAFLLGLLWMSLPLAYQLARVGYTRKW